MDHPAALASLNFSIMKKAILITLLCLSGLVAQAQIPQPDPDTTAKHFLIVASIKNLQEVSAGQLAAQGATRPDVKSFGQMMVKDHGQAEQKLMQLAKSKGIILPAAATGGIQPDLNLKNAGGNFDQLYVHAMVSGHQNTVETFQNYAITGKDPDVRAFAQHMLSGLQQHLADIKSIEGKLKGAAK
jgi:putative membrane protein